MINAPAALQIQFWSIDKFIFYVRNPRKNEAAVDRMCSSIREFGFKVPVLARGDGTVSDGHLRLKAARKLESWPGGDTTSIPVILCDEWTDAQVKAFRLLVNRSATWAAWDEELLALELQELNEADFDLSLTGFDRLPSSPADHLGQRADGADKNVVLVSARAVLVRAEEERALVREGRRKLYDLDLSLAEVHHGRFRRDQIRSPNSKACRTDAAPDPEPRQEGRDGLRSLPGEWHHSGQRPN